MGRAAPSRPLSRSPIYYPSSLARIGTLARRNRSVMPDIHDIRSFSSSA